MTAQEKLTELYAERDGKSAELRKVDEQITVVERELVKSRTREAECAVRDGVASP